MMKAKLSKLFLIFGVIIFSLTFTGCNTNSNNSTSHDNSISDTTSSTVDGNYYYVTLTGEFNAILNDIKSQYIAGETVYVNLPYINDAQYYLFINGEFINNYTRDNLILVSKFTMPEEDIIMHITMDRLYGKNEFTFRDLFFWTNKLDEITSMTHDIQYNNDSTGALIERKYINDKNEILSFLNITEQLLVKTNLIEYNFPITKQSKYDFYNRENEIIGRIQIQNGYICFPHFDCFLLLKFKNENYSLPSLNNVELTTYYFHKDKSYGVYYIDNDDNDDNDIPVGSSYDTFNIHSLEFIKYTSVTTNLIPYRYVKTDFGKILLINSTVFIFNDEYFEIISTNRPTYGISHL